jgi:hypothetical protein
LGLKRPVGQRLQKGNVRYRGLVSLRELACTFQVSGSGG